MVLKMSSMPNPFQSVKRFQASKSAEALKINHFVASEK